ncbi:MAG: hypothetical protein JWM03_415 [Rhodocyclales bacterium]|nr:hypothetical protein [Rhodocyclales bacterium]
MDNLTAVSNIAASNAIAGLTAPVSASGTPAATSALIEPSVIVDFSAFAQSLLAQQANDPNLSIDAALARNLGNLPLASSASGPLFTPAGLLQQFTSSLLLSQLESNGSISANDKQLIEALQSPPADASANPPVVATPTANANPANDAPTRTPPPSAQESRSVVTAPNASLATNNTSPPSTDLAATNTEPTQNNPVSNATNDTVIAAQTTPPAVSDDPLLNTNLDPYQQAALASGLTSFGKELNVFVPSSPNDTTPPPVNAIMPVTAVRRVVPRSDEPAGASAS